MPNFYDNARFVTSASQLNQLPPEDGIIEIAFAGRSNAGKSSLLNSLTRQKSLARVSKTPGRTQLINFFEISQQCYLVDLPGYGYAKVAEAIKERWQQTLMNYLIERQSLRGLILVMDIRHPLKPMDQALLEWASREANLPVHIVLTKADKLKKSPAKSTLLQVRQRAAEISAQITVQTYSSLKNTGKPELEAKLDEWFEFSDFNLF